MSIASAGVSTADSQAYAAGRRAISTAHPRLFGSLERLQGLKAARPEAYRRMAAFARQKDPEAYNLDAHDRILCLSLTAAIEGDAALAAEAHRLAMVYVNGEIRFGHETYGHDMARVAIAYDLCHAQFSAEDRQKLFAYMDKTIDANVNEEVSVFHNGFYGYKNWGIGLICYATMHENPRAGEFLAVLENEVVTRAAPALEFGGAGGSFCEGYYLNYFLYEWMFFYEVAALVEGLDYYCLSPGFWNSRAVASMFETEPEYGENNLRRPVPIGDGGRMPKIIYDRLLTTRRLLIQRMPDDPGHQAVLEYDQASPPLFAPGGAYKEFLWGLPVWQGAGKGAGLETFKLSHYSPAAGAVYARSSWQEEATHFYFHCSKRYTAHQHLDVGNFLIYKQGELVGDGGHYDHFFNDNCVNYYMRSIAHNVVLVYDPAEQFQTMRAGPPPVNDGGQYFPWTGTPMRHNGFAWDVEHFQANRPLTDIAEVLAVEDTGEYVYVAGDCTRAYHPAKVANFTRQIVFLRPGTFVIFDRVTARKAGWEKTWLLQCINPPTGVELNADLAGLRQFQFSAGAGRGTMFVQTLLPEKTSTRFCAGEQLYEHHGHKCVPESLRPRPPECRVEVKATAAAEQTLFLHVLTATGPEVAAAPVATVAREGSAVRVTVGAATVGFDADRIKMAVQFAR